LCVFLAIPFSSPPFLVLHVRFLPGPSIGRRHRNSQALRSALPLVISLFPRFDLLFPPNLLGPFFFSSPLPFALSALPPNFRQQNKARCTDVAPKLSKGDVSRRLSWRGSFQVGVRDLLPFRIFLCLDRTIMNARMHLHDGVPIACVRTGALSIDAAHSSPLLSFATLRRCLLREGQNYLLTYFPILLLCSRYLRVCNPIPGRFQVLGFTSFSVASFFFFFFFLFSLFFLFLFLDRFIGLSFPPPPHPTTPPTTPPPPHPPPPPPPPPPSFDNSVKHSCREERRAGD